MTLQIRKSKHNAELTWKSLDPLKEVKVVIDRDKDGRITCLIHEMLHIQFYPLLEGVFGKKLEEAAIEAWESEINKYVARSPQRVEKWRRILEAKLKGQDDAS